MPGVWAPISTKAIFDPGTTIVRPFSSVSESKESASTAFCTASNVFSIFFAVGAGHLYGKNGVISLLRKEGYTVEPLK